jgi:hypothetical protein
MEFPGETFSVAGCANRRGFAPARGHGPGSTRRMLPWMEGLDLEGLLGGFSLYTIFLAVLFGIVGFAAFRYGRKNSEPRPLLLGIALMAYDRVGPDAGPLLSALRARRPIRPRCRGDHHRWKREGPGKRDLIGPLSSAPSRRIGLLPATGERRIGFPT